MASDELPQVAGYRYSDEMLHVMFISSVPQDDDAAVKYMQDLTDMGIKVMYVEKREPGSFQYKLLPTLYDAIKNEFRRVGS